MALAGINHGLDGETHPFFQNLPSPRLSVVQYLGVIMEDFGDAVAAKLSYDAESLGFGLALNGMSNVTKARARSHHINAAIEAVLRNLR